MNNLKLILEHEGQVKKEYVINRDHVVTAKAYVDVNSDMKVIDILTLSSLIKIRFHGYQLNVPEYKENINDDVRRILTHVLDEGDGSYTVLLVSKQECRIDITTTIRGV